MKRFKPFFYLLLAVMLVPLASCDDDDDDDVEPSRMQLLTSSQWTGFAAFANGTDITAFLANDPDKPVDVRTWKLKFNTNGSYTIEGDGLDPSPFTGTWKFTNNEQSILFDEDVPGESETINISRLTSSELFLEMEFEDDDGSTIDGEVRFRH